MLGFFHSQGEPESEPHFVGESISVPGEDTQARNPESGLILFIFK